MPMLLIHEKIQGDSPFTDTLTLPYDQRQKGRQRVVLDSGREAGMILPSGTSLRPGDLLRDNMGAVILVRAAHELVTTARTSDPLRLARACYHLGNRHIPVQVGPGWVRYIHDHVIDQMVVQLGLKICGERAVFEPEAGAYSGGNHGAQGSAHAHAHAH